MNYGYTNKGTSTPVWSSNSTKDFVPECDQYMPESQKKGKIHGYVVTHGELHVRKNKHGLKAKLCTRRGCFDSIFDSW